MVGYKYMKLNGPFLGIFSGLVLSSITFISCVDEYMPEIDAKYDEVLVVDGEITNKPEPVVVKLSLSSSVENPDFRPQVGYQVNILDNLGNSTTLLDLGNGSYISPVNEIQGVPGRSYKVRIFSPQDKVYESEFEEMKEPVEIDTVYVEFETQENTLYSFDLEGYRFYVSTKASTQDTTYFLWKLDATYKYNANHFIKYVFDGELRQFSHYDSLHTCWLTYQVPEIFTHHTLNTSGTNLVGYPLHYVNTLDKKLSIRYSLLTQQYVVSKKTHIFWKHLKEQSSELGSMYSVQPFQVRGNIKNINDPDELVLGYFMVASVTENRIFVNRPWYADFHYLLECFFNTSDFYDMLWSMIDQWPIYLAAVYGEAGGQAPALPASQECVDCTESGGTIIKPEFWIDNYNERKNY